jgi:hypothetical protein
VGDVCASAFFVEFVSFPVDQFAGNSRILYLGVPKGEAAPMIFLVSQAIRL